MTNEVQLAWHFPGLIVLYLLESYKNTLEVLTNKFLLHCTKPNARRLRFKQQFTVFSKNTGRS